MHKKVLSITGDFSFTFYLKSVHCLFYWKPIQGTSKVGSSMILASKT